MMRLITGTTRRSILTLLRLAGIILLVLGIIQPIRSQEKVTVQKVVIDAGHGGKDPGAIGKHAREKDIALDVALKLGDYIKQQFPDVQVIFTRKTDVFIELHRRAQIANEHKADLFISIHCNATKSATPRGSETYVMGLHRSQTNLEVAKKENASILYELDYATVYEGFNPNSDESYITFSLFQNAYLEQSLVFATVLQQEFRDYTGMIDRGVRQAGFLVLYRTTMPGVLVELGFLSHPEEEKYLASAEGQHKIARGLFRAFNQFKTGLEGSIAVVVEPDSSATDKPPDQAAQTTPQVVFKVQIGTAGKQLPKDAPAFNGLKNVGFYRHDGLIKYTIGNEKTFDDALPLLELAKQKGVKGPFIIAFINGERVTVEEAKAVLNR